MGVCALKYVALGRGRMPSHSLLFNDLDCLAGRSKSCLLSLVSVGSDSVSERIHKKLTNGSLRCARARNFASIVCSPSACPTCQYGFPS